ncbi:MAG: type II methionyl aminopeptidase [Nanoarchaeota archaeon]|nr:type II methionyl aminopeptidase [Nanoarchaeota archaeon]MBU4085968.1 type II methionyl aminopeptidase [Nanoarchaeota archaeon]
MNPQEIDNYRKAGNIAKQVKKYAKQLAEPGSSLLGIAEKIEAKILELGGKCAFPVNLCIDDIAAHYTPSSDDKTTAEGLLKIDIGVHINGAIADTAFSIDLSNLEENKKLIEASEKALEEGIKTIREGIELWKIGKAIQDKIESYQFSPIRNLCGHSLAEFQIHAGTTIPNCNNSSSNIIKPGAYAIEPFATSGHGIVYDGKPSGIYRLEARKAIRDPVARKILDFVEQEYKTLPFCSRWIVNKFGPRSLLALHLLEQDEILHQYPQLIEKSHSKVAQSENTVILVNNTIEVIT